MHVGHYIQIMVMAHMQRAGHRPIALIGGGTAMVGDPSGRTDMREMMTREIIENAQAFKNKCPGSWIFPRTRPLWRIMPIGFWTLTMSNSCGK